MGKLQAYTKYTPVEYDYISQLPEDWQLLPNIAIFQERIERGHEDKELLSVTIGRGVIKQSELDKKDSSTLDKSKYLLVYPGDLVYSMRFRQGASGYSIYKGIVSPACTVLKPKKGVELNPRFFYYMFRTGFFKNYVERFAYGIADGQIPLRYVDFKRMYSIVPPLETQNTIVAYLDRKTQQLQEFIAKKERLIELLEEKKSNSIRNILTKGFRKCNTKNSCVNWIGQIPEDWELVQLRYLCKINTGEKNTEDRIDNGQYPFYVRSQTPERINSYSFDGEAILTAGDGAGVGKVFHYVNEKFDYHQRVYKISDFRRLEGKYLFYFLKVNFFYVALLGDAKSTVDSLRLPLLKSFWVCFPSNEEEQKAILSKIDEMSREIDNAILKIQLEIEKAKEYQESLITQIVTGQLKVPENINSNLGKDIDLGMVAEPNTEYHSNS